MIVLGQNILITPIEEETKTKGGLIMSAADTKDLRYKKATVVAVGNSLDGIKPNNIIYFDKAAGHNIRVNDEMYTVITVRDAVVVV